MPDVDNGLEIYAGLNLAIGSVADEIKATRKSLQKLADKNVLPVLYRASATATVNANGFAVINIGGPDMGHIWSVMSLAIVGQNPQTPIVGRGDVIISAMSVATFLNTGGNNPLAAVGENDWRDYTVSLPSVAFYSINQMPARMNEEVQVVISGATAGTILCCSGQITDFEEAANKQGWQI